MRVALGQSSELTHEYLTFAKQLGLKGVQLNTPILPSDDGYWHEYDLRQLVKRCESYGLQLEAIENVPTYFYSRAMLGVEGRDQQIENYQKTIRNMGKVGIPLLGYHYMPNGVWRTPNQRGRGGALVTAFDINKISEGLVAGVENLEIAHGRTFSEDEMWENYFYFMQAVLPVAVESGVKLALHPDDPPVPALGGIARLFYRVEG
ncbi:MAG: mannonate dehydratase, partial [Anaerolineae bacterium]|nr:mannonate dehydratase [Anaerolineae bacterium]